MSDENQHWVPKFLIKNFADTDGRVFCLNIKTDEITKPPPKYAASSPGFNNFSTEGGAVSFEDQLEKIETSAAPALRRIVNSRSIAGLTEKQRIDVSNFIAAQSFRTEAFYKGLDTAQHRENFGSVFSALWRSAFLLSAEILRRKWAIMTIENDEIFYLGDHPVVLQHTENPSSDQDLGFDIQGVEAFLPLTPKCALYMPCASTSQEIISGYENALAAPEIIRLAKLQGNDALIDTEKFLEISRRIMRNTRELYEAFTIGSAFVATSENIENLNYLQCAWAHAAVYSNKRDFIFAKKVFRQSPQYRSTVKVKLGTFDVRSRNNT